ncbi:MAG: phosphate/phosphite/phosphonate ABC transporter substrate-binding protein [Acidiferrobacterales bacterium]
MSYSKCETNNVGNMASILPRIFLSAAISILLLASGTQTASAYANEGILELAIQPVLSEAKTKKAFKPLAEYLSKVTGKQVVVKTMPNFMAYWDTVRRPDSYDLILDAAHFTDYRREKYGYKILAKIPDSVSYSLIVLAENFIFDPSELIGKRIATLGAPSIGAARLDALFPNPMRQPIIVEVANADKGIKLLLDKNVFAAIIPTPLVSRTMAEGKDISVVMVTEPAPHIALSASPKMDANTVAIIRKAIIAANKSPAGKIMLKEIGFPQFDPANAKIYSGQSKLLEKYWGY